MTINKFPAFAKIITASFQAVIKAPQVFVTGVDGDTLPTNIDRRLVLRTTAQAVGEKQ